MLEVTGTVDQVIAGRYRLEELVGHGGMGCVWRASHLNLGTPVAIKLVRPSVASRPGMLERFLREAKAAAVLRGAHVVQILDHGVDGGAPFIAMEYLEGESLAARLKRERTLAPDAVLTVMTGVARALGRAHKKGIIHRDLKPDNIFIAKDEGGEIVKVLDFGIAKLLAGVALDSEERKSTETGTMLGTPCYMSPEQARGRKELDARSDLWSFAVIAFECLTGRRPFDADALGELMMQICSEPVPVPSSLAKVPVGFDAWFERATKRDPAERYPAVRELSAALAEILVPGQPWTGVTADGEPSVDHAPVTPLEVQATVPMVTPEALLYELPRHTPAVVADTVAAEAPASAPEVSAAIREPAAETREPPSAAEARLAAEARPGHVDGDSSASRRRPGRALLIGAAAVVAVAVIGIAVSRSDKPTGTATTATVAVSAPAQTSTLVGAPTGNQLSSTPTAIDGAGSSRPAGTATPTDTALAVPPPKDTARTIAALPKTAPAASTGTQPKASVAPVNAPPGKATAAQPTASPKAQPSASKAELPREVFE